MGLHYSGHNCLSDNCTAAIRPPAKDALAGILLSLTDFGATWNHKYLSRHPPQSYRLRSGMHKALSVASMPDRH